MKPLGGKREGAGRKSRRIESDAKSAIKKALQRYSGDKPALEKIWNSILEESIKGSFKHQQLFLNYFYGKPVDNVNVQGAIVVNFTRKVV